jgi:hypothetical protein
LPGWRINLNGITYFGRSDSRSITTDANGQYDVTGIWPGTYTVSEVWRNNWRQTLPPALASYVVALGKEENRTGVDFGNKVDSSFSASFRSFIPESLALSHDKKGKHKPLPTAPDRDEFCVRFLNDGVLPASKLSAQFVVGIMPGTLSFDRPGSEIPSGKPKKLDLSFTPPLAVGDSVTVHAFGNKPVPQKIAKWRWTFNDASFSSWKTTFDSCLNLVRYPMPNALNVVQLVGAGLKVGLGGPHSVVATNYKNIISSLIERGDRMHIGDPRSLGKFSNGRSIKSQQKFLTPTKHNNKLFAEAIALQTNIRASDLGVAPHGFGNLIFDDGSGSAHPFNGISIREVAARLDSFMTGYNETTKTAVPPPSLAAYDSIAIWHAIREIDSAFSGPIDTDQFSGGLMMKAVRPLTDVPYLRLDTSAARRAYIPPLSNRVLVPDQSALYQNYPNPFNPTTVIPFELAQPSFVTVKVYNILGQEVATLLNREQMEDGPQEVGFNAASLPSGVYFYRITAEGIPDGEAGVGAGKFVAVRKMLLVR